MQLRPEIRAVPILKALLCAQLEEERSGKRCLQAALEQSQGALQRVKQGEVRACGAGGGEGPAEAPVAAGKTGPQPRWQSWAGQDCGPTGSA